MKKDVGGAANVGNLIFHDARNSVGQLRRRTRSQKLAQISSDSVLFPFSRDLSHLLWHSLQSSELRHVGRMFDGHQRHIIDCSHFSQKQVFGHLFSWHHELPKLCMPLERTLTKCQWQHCLLRHLCRRLCLRMQFRQTFRPCTTENANPPKNWDLVSTRRLTIWWKKVLFQVLRISCVGRPDDVDRGASCLEHRAS